MSNLTITSCFSPMKWGKIGEMSWVSHFFYETFLHFSLDISSLFALNK